MCELSPLRPVGVRARPSRLPAVLPTHCRGYGLDPTLPSKAFQASFLAGINNTANGLIAAATKFVEGGGELWIGETAMAWHSGRDGVTNTFLCVGAGSPLLF